MQTDGDEMIYLTCYGVPVEGKPPDGKPFFVYDQQGAWRLGNGDLLEAIDDVCARIHEALATRIFGSYDGYYTILREAPDWIHTAGLDSESSMSKQDFEKITRAHPSEELHKLLYLHDCRKLVYGIQETIKEVVYLQGEFFRGLNLDDLFHPPSIIPDGLRHSSSPVTSKLIAFVNVIYVRLHSLLDYTVKLAYEVEHLKTSFAEYPRLSSRHKLYGDRRHVSWNMKAGTLFEPCELAVEIETFRNLVIHDGLLDHYPKVYEDRKDGVVVERFLLLPDRVGGRLSTSTNRNLFYNGEDKINLRLPALLAEFQERILASVNEILSVLR